MATLSPERAGRAADSSQALSASRRRRKLREAVIGYLFVLPAAAATFIFGLWPVVAGFYESLKSGSPITNKYVGLANYVRSLGSLTYIFLFALCAIFIMLGYRAWRSALLKSQLSNRRLTAFVVAGLIGGLGLIALGVLRVTGADGYSWFPALLLLIATGLYYTTDTWDTAPGRRDEAAVVIVWGLLLALGALASGVLGLPGPLGGGVGGLLSFVALIAVIYLLIPRLARIHSLGTVTSTLLMGTLILGAILLARFTYHDMQRSVQEARTLAAAIFSPAAASASVPIADAEARLGGLALADPELMVEVRVGGETIHAPLAPDAYDELPLDWIDRLEAGFAANQKVQVVLPDGSIAEGQLVGAGGEGLSVGFTADNPQAVTDVDLYSALQVGEGVVQTEGFTELVTRQATATLGMLVGLAAIFFMSHLRRQIDDEENPRAYRWLHWGRLAMGAVVALLFFYVLGAIQLSQQAASGIGALSEDQFKRAYTFALGAAPPATLQARQIQAELLYWPQVFSVGLGVCLLAFAYLVWKSAQRREHPLGFALTVLLAIALMVGGWLLLSELPRALELGGRETDEAIAALKRTAIYSVGTVPVQLGLGLFLAYLLFSEISWGKSLYRVIYFMPYIAPSVATSTVFLVIFRYEAGSLANRAVGLLGMGPLTWLKDPNGIFKILYEQLGGNPLHFPAVLAGPSLALTTVILYNIWVFAGYNAVVFLAGLGAIPRELYEAAEVDGAGRWSRFRNITLPLLSPTTFFLTMLSVVGTFKAFSHIYVLRGQATGKEIDTMAVHIFNTLYSANDPGYAAALAFSLFGVILVLTLVQNRLAREQVFYG